MVIGNVVEEMELVFGKHQTSSNGVDGSIAPALIKEATIVVEVFKVRNVSIGAQPDEH